MSIIFNDLNDVYNYLEQDIYATKREWELTTAIRSLMDRITDEEVKKKLKWECFVFDFYIQDGDVKPMNSSTKEDGTTLYCYPSYDDFGKEGIEYLNERRKDVKNDFLISRYNHILWNSPAPHKHQQQAKDATDAYLRILKNLSCISEEKKEGWDCLQIFKNGFKVAVQSKYKIDDFKGIINSWLYHKAKFPSETKIFLLKYMLEMPQFKSADFEGSLELINKIAAARTKKKTDYFFSKEIYGTGLKIAQRLGTNTKIWNNKIGDAIVKMADHRMDDESRMIPLSMLKEAIPYYKLAGNEKKVKEIEHRYFELKKELKLAKIEVPLHEEAAESLTQYLDTKTTELMKLDSQKIIGYLLTGSDIFPKKKWLVDVSKNKDSIFMDFATLIRFDINNNVSKESDDKQTKERNRIYENYQLYMNLSVLPYLHRIFVEGINCGKVTFPALMRFILENTWLGQEFTDFDSAGDLVKYRWTSLIGPSLHGYFVQTESALKSNNPYTNYVMPIDSLTLKFEGVLRDFARLVGISTTVAGKKDVLREKYIEELLADKGIQKYFNEDDVLFFNYLFVAKNGMNLRNNVAHCFYRFNNYNFLIMHLLICAFLRIGKYKLKTEKK